MSKTPPAPASAEALAREGWRLTDDALAQAAIEVARAQAGLQGALRRARDAPQRSLADVAAALEVAAQHLQAALRRRGLESFGKIGKSAVYDPQIHGLEWGRAHSGEAVRVTAPGVRRVDGETLVKAAVRPIRARATA